MKRVLVVLALAVFTTGMFVSCTPEDTATEDQIYEQASDKDEEPDDQDPNS